MPAMKKVVAMKAQKAPAAMKAASSPPAMKKGGASSSSSSAAPAKKGKAGKEPEKKEAEKASPGKGAKGGKKAKDAAAQDAKKEAQREIDERVEKVQAVLKFSHDKVVTDMLLGLAKTSFSRGTHNRTPTEHQTIDMIRNNVHALREEAAHDKYLKEQAMAHAQTQCTHIRGQLAGQKDALGNKKEAIALQEETVAAADVQVKQASEDKKAFMAEKKKFLKELEKAESNVSEAQEGFAVFETLKASPPAGDKDKKKLIGQITPLLKKDKMGVEESLVASAPEALKRAPADRRIFDNMVVDTINQHCKDYLEKLQDIRLGMEPKREQSEQEEAARAADLEAKQQHLINAQDQLKLLQSQSVEAAKNIKEAEKMAKEAKEEQENAELLYEAAVQKKQQIDDAMEAVEELTARPYDHTLSTAPQAGGVVTDDSDAAPGDALVTVEDSDAPADGDGDVHMLEDGSDE